MSEIFAERTFLVLRSWIGGGVHCQEIITSVMAVVKIVTREGKSICTLSVVRFLPLCHHLHCAALCCLPSSVAHAHLRRHGVQYRQYSSLLY